MQLKEMRSISKHRDGLNFVPMLAQPTPPSSSRTRFSVTSRKSSSFSLHSKGGVPIACYNGNYEGDTSMFGAHNYGHIKPPTMHSRHMDLIDTDSDTDYKRDLQLYANKETTSDTRTQLMRMWEMHKRKLLTPERLKQLTDFSKRLHNSYCFQKVCELLVLAHGLLLWCTHLLMLGALRVNAYSSGLWRGKTLLRNTARRLLWCMTLAKCGDASLFALIMITAPLLFAVGVFGFVISLYCAFKEWLNRAGYFSRA